jgi:hypothetical protein
MVRRLLTSAAILLLFSAALGWAIRLPRLKRIASSIGVLLQLSGAPVPASSATLSEHELEELNSMPPQQQAERLLERTINHYAGAGDELARRLESWSGKIHSTPELEHLTDTAYFSSDLRVRAAALELCLVRDGIRKTPQQVDDLILEAAATTERRYFRLSTLGILGNRGVEPEKVLQTLTYYAHDPTGPARAAAINGLGLLGTEGTIPVLLDIFRHDSSSDLRERAACNLADSGMLSRDLRQKAVPELIAFLQDPELDQTTRKWVLQALREITQQNLPDNPSAWLSWYSSRPER